MSCGVESCGVEADCLDVGADGEGVSCGVEADCLDVGAGVSIGALGAASALPEHDSRRAALTMRTVGSLHVASKRSR